ncbi:MAG: LamG domain-containing protein [Ktedonobacterales bacterium]|nr:LamG domain-containing protein [Ktedonobacterales bacterium]
MTLATQMLIDGAKAVYALNDLTGTTTAVDATGIYSGTYTGNVQPGQPSIIRAEPLTPSTYFDGASGYVALPVGLDPTGWSKITVEGVFQLPVAPASNERLIANSHTDANFKGFQMLINSSLNGGVFNVGTGGSGSGFAGFTVPISLNTPYHFTGTYDGAQVLIFLNGAPVGGVPWTGTIASSGFPINIGRNPAYTGDYSTALLSCFAIYNAVLTPAQAAAHAYLALHPPAIITKQQVVKVYSAAGAFLDVWRDAPLLGDQGNASGATAPKFAVNAVTSQVTVTLPRSFDNFDEAGDRRGRGTVGAGNVVQFWTYDNGTLTNGRLVYQGYIDGYQPAIDDADNETVQVMLTPFDTALGDVQFIGTQNFGVAGSATTYVDPAAMFKWPFAPVIAATSSSTVTAGTTTAITVSNATNMTPGYTLFLRGTGVDSAKTNTPTILSIVGNTVTFTAAIPTNSYSNTIIIAGIAPLTSVTVVTGGSTSALTVSATTGLAVNMSVGIVGTGGDVGKAEMATILSIVGSVVTFTAPLVNSYSATIGIGPALSFDLITNRPYTYPLTLDAGNPAQAGSPYQLQFHNQNLADYFEAVRTLAPQNWFWRTNHDTLTVSFAQAPTTPTHTFVVGKHINQPQYQKDYNTLKNDIYVKGTGVTSRATGSDIALYGRRTLTIVEPRIIDQHTCDRYAAAVLAQQDVVQYRSTINVVDNRGDLSNLGYDIETIKVGQTCRIENPQFNAEQTLWDQAGWDVDSWDFLPTAQINQTVVIAGLTYQFDTVQLELSILQPSQNRFLTNLARQFAASQFN